MGEIKNPKHEVLRNKEDVCEGICLFLYKNFVKLLAKAVRLMYNTIKEMYNARTRKRRYHYETDLCQ